MRNEVRVLDQFLMTGFVSIVTGGATGLGKAMALALAQAGSHIVIADIDYESAVHTADEIKSSENVKTMAIALDVTKTDEITRMAEMVQEAFGRIDVLINNAGITLIKPTEDIEDDEWLRIMDVNLNSVFKVSREIGKVMIKQKSGSIINMASMSGIVANMPQYQSGYNSTKAGVIMLTKSLAAEWVTHNVRVNAIAPGYMKGGMKTPEYPELEKWREKWVDMTPMKRFGNPEELGGLAVYLASGASSYMTGSTLVIDGGYTLW